MEISQLVFVLIFIIVIFLLSKIRDLQSIKNQQQIEILETELHYQKGLNQELMTDLEPSAMESPYWGSGTIASQIRFIERTENELSVLRKKRIKFLLFFY